MSIYDRDYYRGESTQRRGGSFSDTFASLGQSMPPVLKSLLIINIAVFIICWFFERSGASFFLANVLRDQFNRVISVHPSRFDMWFGLYNPNLIGKFAFWQLITYQFIHGGFLHLFFNMFSLYMIGRFVERQIGSIPFLKLYLIGGIFAGVINVFFNIFSGVPTVGASGSICAIVAAFGLMNPNARIGFLILFIPVFLKAKTFVIVFAIITIFMAFGTSGSIAHMAHLGGIIFGWMYAYNIWSVGRMINGRRTTVNFARKKGGGGLFSSLKRIFGKGPSYYNGEEFEDGSYTNINSHGSSKNDWDTRIDSILDKMSKSGVHSLTDEEWDILDKHKKGK